MKKIIKALKKYEDVIDYLLVVALAISVITQNYATLMLGGYAYLAIFLNRITKEIRELRNDIRNNRNNLL